MTARRFTVQLERVQKTATVFRVPFDLEEAFGRARPPVKMTIGDYTWRTTAGVYDGVGHVVVIVRRKPRPASTRPAGWR